MTAAGDDEAAVALDDEQDDENEEDDGPEEEAVVITAVDALGRSIAIDAESVPLAREDMRDNKRRRGLVGKGTVAAGVGAGAGGATIGAGGSGDPTLAEMVAHERAGGEDMDANFARNVARMGEHFMRTDGRAAAVTRSGPDGVTPDAASARRRRAVAGKHFKGGVALGGAGGGSRAGVDEDDDQAVGRDAALFAADGGRERTARRQAEEARARAVRDHRRWEGGVQARRALSFPRLSSGWYHDLSGQPV